MRNVLARGSRAPIVLFAARQTTRLVCLALIAVAAGPTIASATSVTFDTASTAKDTAGDPVSAQVTLTLIPATMTTPAEIEVQLTNTLKDPTDVGQNVTGVSFSVSTGSTGSSVSSSSGTSRLFSTDSTWTDTAVSNVGWGFAQSSGDISLSWFTRDKSITGQNAQWTLIGAPGNNNKYNNDNGSLGTNNAHNPFLANTITWFLDVPGVTSSSTISSVVFAFGTTSGDNLPGTPVGTPPTLTPEPSTVLGTGIAAVVGLLLARRRRRNAA